MKSVKNYILKHWQSWLATTLVVGTVVGLLWYRLASLVPGLSGPEAISLQGTGSLKAILLNPVFLPYKLAQYGLLKLGFDSVLAIRSVSALFGLITVLLFYFVLRLWYTKRVSVLATLLLCSSAWFLHIARIATPSILFPLCAALLLLYGASVRASKRNRYWIILGAAVATAVIYVPGLIWLVACLILWQRRYIAEVVKPLAIWQRIVALLLGTVILMPLVYASVHDLHVLQNILAIPLYFEPMRWLTNAYRVPKLLFIRGPLNPAIWVGVMPLLDIFMMGMFFLGLYNYYLRKNLVRTSVLILFFAVTVLLLTVSTTVVIGLLIPAVFLIITAGITFFLQQWMTVFPKNPVARSIGFVLILSAISISVLFQLKSYYVAWPLAPATKATYRLKIDS